MAKPFVALLAVLVLAVPAAAQDPAPDDPQGSDPQAEPQPASPEGGNGTEPSMISSATSLLPSGSSSSTEESSEESSPNRTLCPLVKSNVGDPAVPREQWIIVDPYGCFQKVVYRVLGWPPIIVSNPL